jgi:hypothetical protein
MIMMKMIYNWRYFINIEFIFDELKLIKTKLIFDKLKGRVLVKPEDQLELTEHVSFNQKLV